MKHSKFISIVLVFAMVLTMVSLAVTTAFASTVEDGYYLMGVLNGSPRWDEATLSTNRKLEANPFGYGEYMLDWAFSDGDSIKIAKVENGVITKWYKDGMDNDFKITYESAGTGDCTVYFRPEGNSDWTYYYLTVIPKVEPTEQTEPTQAQKLSDGYYLSGKINGVEQSTVDTITADKKLVANPKVSGEYTIDYSLSGGDNFSVVEIKDGVITKSRVNGLNITCLVSESGEKTVYFKPETSITSPYTYLFFKAKSQQRPQMPIKTIYLNTANSDWTISNGESILASSGSTLDILQFSFMKKVSENIYSFEVPIIENADYFQFEKLSEGLYPETKYVEGKRWTNIVKYSQSLSMPTGTDNMYNISSNTWGYYSPTSPIDDGYYLMGSFGGVAKWDAASLSKDRKFAENEFAPGEFMLDYTFRSGDEIKVAKVENGTITAWYNDLGENYKIDDGNKGKATVYFRPNGNTDWSYYYLTVIPKTELKYFRGDVNLSGSVEIIDVTIIQRYLAHFGDNLSQVQVACADADANGDVNIVDCTQIQRFLAHLSCSSHVGEAFSIG